MSCSITAFGIFSFLSQIVSAVDLKALNRLLATHRDVASHLCKRASEDQAYDVRYFYAPRLCLLNISYRARASLRLRHWGRNSPPHSSKWTLGYLTPMPTKT